MKKISIIVISVIVVIAVVAAVAFYFYTNKVSEAAKNIENYINTALKTEQAKFNTQNINDKFEFEPFKCKGNISITCVSSNISLSSHELDMKFKDNKLVLKPLVKSLDVSFGSDAAIDLKDIDTKPHIDFSMDCEDTFDLKSEKSMVIENGNCKFTYNDIKMDVGTNMYLKHKEFETATVPELLKKLENNSNLYEVILDESKTATKSIYLSIQSKALFKDIVKETQKLALAGDNVTEESIKAQYEDAKMMLNMFGSDNSTEARAIKDLMFAVGEVVEQRSNNITVDLQLKEGQDIEELIEKNMGPDFNIYDITIVNK